MKSRTNLALAVLCLGFLAVAAQAQAPVSVTISSITATLPLGATHRFFAIVTGTSTADVTWSVNGVVGGNSSVGAIDASGVYAAPLSAMNVTVTATSVADRTKSASAAVSITHFVVRTRLSQPIER